MKIHSFLGLHSKLTRPLFLLPAFSSRPPLHASLTSTSSDLIIPERISEQNLLFIRIPLTSLSVFSYYCSLVKIIPPFWKIILPFFYFRFQLWIFSQNISSLQRNPLFVSRRFLETEDSAAAAILVLKERETKEDERIKKTSGKRKLFGSDPEEPFG